MSQKFTTLMTFGCSFTDGLITWPNHLSEKLNLKLLNYGQVGAGNGYISRSAIYNINKFLETSNTNNLLVGIMWSGAARTEHYRTNPIIHKSSEYFRFVEEDKGRWVKVQLHGNDALSTSWLRNFYDNHGIYILTLEHILRTQWFLDSRNINYFMTTFSPATLPDDKLLKNPSIGHLEKMIDWTKFIPITNCLDWCKTKVMITKEQKSFFERIKEHTNKELYLDATHPTKEEHKIFTERVIIPHVREKFGNYINPCKEGEKDVL